MLGQRRSGTKLASTLKVVVVAALPMLAERDGEPETRGAAVVGRSSIRLCEGSSPARGASFHPAGPRQVNQPTVDDDDDPVARRFRDVPPRSVRKPAPQGGNGGRLLPPFHFQ